MHEPPFAVIAIGGARNSTPANRRLGEGRGFEYAPCIGQKTLQGDSCFLWALTAPTSAKNCRCALYPVSAPVVFVIIVQAFLALLGLRRRRLPF